MTRAQKGALRRLRRYHRLPITPANSPSSIGRPTARWLIGKGWAAECNRPAGTLRITAAGMRAEEMVTKHGRAFDQLELELGR